MALVLYARNGNALSGGHDGDSGGKVNILGDDSIGH